MEIADPLTGGGLRQEFTLAEGAVATSGIGTRLWEIGNGYAHHLLDPSTGRPAWTGVIQATALAPTAVEAEARAKTALLRGAREGIAVLERHGGVLLLDDGSLRTAGRLRDELRPRS